MRIIDLPQGSPEWHSWRKTKITASMVPIIMGVSKWTTPYQLFCELTGLSEPREQTKQMQDGLDAEQEARLRFRDDIGVVSHFEPIVVESSEHSWLGASLDGWGHDGTQMCVLEIKNAGNEDHEYARSSKIPEHYYPQVQAQLLATETGYGYYYSYRPNDSIYIRSDACKKFQQEIIEKCKEFLHFLETCTAPPLTDKDHVRIEDPEWTAIARETVYLQNQIKILEKKLELNKKELERRAEGKSCIGGGIKFTKTTRIGSVDYASIPELKEINLDKYRKPNSTFYRITPL